MHQAWRSAMSLFFAVATAVGASVLSTGASLAASTHSGGAARVPAFPGQWGTAQEVPGTADLNLGGDAGGVSVSCPVPGNCSAGGFYTDSSNHLQVFVVSQVNGTWGTAVEVPGTAALNQGGNALITSVSCAWVGDCSVGGSYKDGSGHTQAFVVSQVNGTWGTAVEVPGTAALNQGGNAASTWVSCASVGNCSVGGDYIDGFGHRQAFVVSQVHGTWGTAVEVPGTAALNQGGNAVITSVSCSWAGNCGASGLYKDGAGHTQAFVVSQVNGTWGTAVEVPGTAALNQGGNAVARSVSCTWAGNCSAGGYYKDASGHVQAFVVSQVHGTWGTAVEVPGIAALNQGGDAGISSVSCAWAGSCSAGGLYTDSSAHQQSFVVSQVNGTWGTAVEVPGTAALNQGNGALISVSCSWAGDCGAGGLYKDGSGHFQAYVVNQVNGAWGTAVEVPGTAALNQGAIAETESVSCGVAGNCSAGGFYTDGSGHFQVFLVDRGFVGETARRGALSH